MTKLFFTGCVLFAILLLNSAFNSKRINTNINVVNSNIRVDFQDTTSDCGIPKMYVSRAVGKQRRRWYKQHQRKDYKEVLGKKETKKILFEAKDFSSFLDRHLSRGIEELRIYIAVFPDSDEWLPKYRKKLTVVLVPIFKNQGETEYYILDPNRGSLIVPHADAKKWIDEFDDKRLPVRGSVGKGNDTKFVDHSRTVISEFNDHIKCLIDREKASGMKLWFSSYLDKTRESNRLPVEKEYFNRMSLQFEITKKILFFRKEINIEKGPNKKVAGTKGYNNGTLCPPCENCPEGFIPQECAKKD